uniref:UDP-glycosyltransferase 1 n=1 Tax=Linum usitatissimum TaxID=4006 RepID=I2BH88_LINUS|nr:UDP-glycosyltransferase 1 [Linum usitatissimum]
MATKKKPHVLLVPHPAQGHVFPMLKLAHKLTDYGISVTVANLDFIHRKIAPEETTSKEQQQGHGTGIRLVSLPDGNGSDFDINDVVKFVETVHKVLPFQLRELLIQQQSLTLSNDKEQEFSWVIADAFLSGAFVVAKELGIKTAALWTAAMENFALMLRIPQLIEAGTIDENGFSTDKELPISISEEILAWKANELPWSVQPEERQTVFFNTSYTHPSKHISLFDHVIVNSFHELEPSAFQLFPNFLPIGPLVTNSTNSGGSFWRQDETCLTWLDNHPSKSVIYVAFGSITILSQKQFQELALGLELAGRPFLWVIRTNFVQGPPGESGLEFPDGYLERVVNIGKIVEWTNQERVLSHPSVGCFLSHCGWNSTLEGLWCGVPFLCWPYFLDQFHNKESICEAWKVGLKLKAEEDGTVGGLITMSEIASKVEQLLNDETIKGNANRLKEVARGTVNQGGSSFHNFLSFVNQLRSTDVVCE